MISQKTLVDVVGKLEAWRAHRNKVWGCRISRQDMQSLLDELSGVNGNQSFKDSMLAITRVYRFDREDV